MTTVTLHDRDAVHLACLRYVGPYGPGVGEFWRDTMAPWLAQHGLMNQPCYGIGYDDPSVIDPNACRYDAAVQVPTGFAPIGGAMLLTLPAGRYAEMPFSGTPIGIGDAWRRLLCDWLPSSGLKLAHAPCFERYPPMNGRSSGDGFGCTLCVGVEP